MPELTALAAEHPLRERARGLLMIALYQCGARPRRCGVFGDVQEAAGRGPRHRPGRRADQDSPSGCWRWTRPSTAPVAAPSVTPRPGRAAGVRLRRPAAPEPARRDPRPGRRDASRARPRPRRCRCRGRAAAEPPRARRRPGRTCRAPPWLPPGCCRASPAGPEPLARGLLPEQRSREGDADRADHRHRGVGKTTLAIRFARQVASRFPDGQLYVNLRGFDPASAPVPPARGAAVVLRRARRPAAGTSRPPLTRRARCCARLLDGKRMMLLLDNAHDADQVRPLLPGSPGCMVLVTSRSQLTGLVVADGACAAAARRARRATRRPSCSPSGSGAERVTAEPSAVAALVEQSAGLPLALSVTCARAVTRPGGRLADLAAELADARGPARRAADRRGDHRPAGGLLLVGRQAQRAGRAAVPAARPAPGTGHLRRRGRLARRDTPAQARAALAELTRASLLTEDAAGRFGCHDLLRAYAAELAAATLSDAERDLARRRIARPLPADRARGRGAPLPGPRPA